MSILADGLVLSRPPVPKSVDYAAHLSSSAAGFSSFGGSAGTGVTCAGISAVGAGFCSTVSQTSTIKFWAFHVVVLLMSFSEAATLGPASNALIAAGVQGKPVFGSVSCTMTRLELVVESTTVVLSWRVARDFIVKAPDRTPAAGRADIPPSNTRFSGHSSALAGAAPT